jgi:hypothetical protein
LNYALEKPTPPGGFVMRQCIEPFGSQVFGGSAESWLVQQAQYDLAHVGTDRLKRL